MRRKILACALAMGVLVSSMSVSAATPRSAADCRASITLTASKGTYVVYEKVSPMNPKTPKKIDGNYKCIDINGKYNTQIVRRELREGHISETKYATAHFRTYMGNMAYYLNYSYAGSVEKYY